MCIDIKIWCVLVYLMETLLETMIGYESIDCKPINTQSKDSISGNTNSNTTVFGVCENIPPSIIEQANSVVLELYTKYKDDAYMFQKTHNYICFQLANVLDNIKKTHDQNQMRIKEMESEQDSFIQTFLNNNQYFYVTTTEKFFMYDGLNYTPYNEDDILHHVLTTITKERQLMSWKKSTKVFIMKRIKEHNLLKSVPESDTIQNVLDSLYPSLFKTRAEAKYFLTIIGDIIFRKCGDLVYFITPKAKPFIREITNMCQLYLGANCSSAIKHKYYEHEYAQCRLVYINDTVQSENIWRSIVSQNALNLLCVACHYSIRYNSADEYIQTYCNDVDLANHAFYLRNNGKQELVKLFVGGYIQKRELRTTVTWKNMLYLWKHFLDSKQVPTVMFQQTLKTLLTKELENCYNEEQDVFVGITSIYLPTIQKFITFWEETVVVDDTLCEMEYEIDELCMLFKKWTESKNEKCGHITISDAQMLDFISYFYPGVEIENDKNVYKIRSVLWDKQQDLQTALDQLKNNVKTKYDTQEYNTHRVLPIVSSYGTFEHLNNPPPSPSSNNKANISIYDAYVWYCKYFSDTKANHPLVSKSFFEKYVFETLSPYIIDDKFISVDWIFA